VETAMYPSANDLFREMLYLQVPPMIETWSEMVKLQARLAPNQAAAWMEKAVAAFPQENNLRATLTAEISAAKRGAHRIARRH